MRLLKYFILQLFNNRNFTILFVLNLSFGLCSFVTLDIFKSSINYSLKSRSKALLGAEFGLSSRRPITKDELGSINNLEDNNSQTEIIEVFSMVAGPTNKSKLVQIKAVDQLFPFFGDIKLKGKNNKIYNGSTKDLESNEIAWIYPELISQLGVKIGQKIKIGQAEFIVMATIESDNAEGISTSMAPRLYIGLSQIKKTQLINFGSVAWYSHLFNFPNLNNKQLNELKSKADTAITSPDIKVYTHENVSQQSARILKYLNDFLGLVSIAALFLAAIGGAFLFRSYLAKQLKFFGIYLSLGLSLKKIIFNQTLQLLILGTVGAILAIIFGYLLTPFLDLFTKGILPFELQKSMEPKTIGLIVLLGCIGSVLIGLPLITQLTNIKPSILFSSKSNHILKKNFWYWLAFIPGILFLWALSIWQSNSITIGSLFTILFLGSVIIISLVAYLFLKLISKVSKPKSLSLRWAIRDLSRHPIASISIFLSVGLGMLLLNLIPQIKASINYELSMPKDSKLPSFFIFDIQENQLAPLLKISDSFNVNLQQTSPMVRARLSTINGKEFSKMQIKGKNLTREEEHEQRTRNRGYNLSYRKNLGAGETIIEGVPFSGVYDSSSDRLPEISIEKRFSQRIGIKINDILGFDIQGVSVKGKVVNLRKVRWTTFQPNFFVMFQPGVLDEAPKTFLSSVPKLDNDIKQKFQDDVVSALPNVSVIDVSRLVERLKGIIDQMSFALQFMTIICLIAGFLVLFSIANYQARQRSSDIALLKSLGAQFPTVKNSFIWQFGLLSFFSGVFGIGLCFIMSFFMSKLLFDSKWVLDVKTPAISLTLLIVVSLLITHLAISQFLKIKPAKLLNND